MTPEERITALEVKMKTLERDMEDFKEAHSKLMERLSNIEKRIALWTGGILVVGYLIEHLFKLVK